jgi:hypothetical protein
VDSFEEIQDTHRATTWVRLHPHNVAHRRWHLEKAERGCWPMEKGIGTQRRFRAEAVASNQPRSTPSSTAHADLVARTGEGGAQRQQRPNMTFQRYGGTQDTHRTTAWERLQPHIALGNLEKGRAWLFGYGERHR